MIQETRRSAPELAAAVAAIARAAKARQDQARRAQAERGKEGGRGKKKSLEGKVARKGFGQRARDDLGRLAGVSGRLIEDAALGSR